MQISPAIFKDSSAISFAVRDVCFIRARAAESAYIDFTNPPVVTIEKK